MWSTTQSRQGWRSNINYNILLTPKKILFGGITVLNKSSDGTMKGHNTLMARHTFDYLSN